MPFNFLLWECLIPGRTSISESGERARIDPDPGECVLTFGVDNRKFRGRFNVEKVCDALFFYKCEEQGPVLLFVELKGADIAAAAEQLGQALRAVQRALQRNAQYRAVVVTRRRAPARRDPLWRRFSENYGVELKISRDGDLRPFFTTYPVNGPYLGNERWKVYPGILTTPIVFMTSEAALIDIFRKAHNFPSQLANEIMYLPSFYYQLPYDGDPASYAPQMNRYGMWVIRSAGPDTYYQNMPGVHGDYGFGGSLWNRASYDPTNGTVSVGDIYRSQKRPDEDHL